MQMVPDEILRGRAELKLEIKELKESLQYKEEQLRAFDLVIHTIKHGGQGVAQAESPIAAGQRFEKMGLQEACILILRDAGKSLFRENIANVLLEGGYSTRSNRFRDVVGSTLSYLSQAGRVDRIKQDDGRVAYAFKEEDDEGGSEDEESGAAEE